MKNLWENLYDRVKDRRYGALFLMSVGLFFGFLAVAVWILRNSSDGFLRVVLLIAMVCFGIWTAISFYRTFFRRPERCDFPRLSSDERRAARSKLKNEMKKQLGRMSRPAPDIDLKY